MRVFDCFCFFNEIDLLEIRLTELDPVVDVFVIVECKRTWKNEAKPLTFAANEARFTRWRNKIRYLVLDEIRDPCSIDMLHRTKRPENDARRREWIQRDYITQGLKDAAPNDLIMVSDIDEIPSRSAISTIVENQLQVRSVIYLEQPCFSGYLNWLIGPNDWIGTKIVEKRFLRTPQLLRMAKPWGHKRALLGTRTIDWWIRNWIDFHALVHPRRLTAAGWHFTTVGDVEAVAYKAAQHIEGWADRPEYRDHDRIRSLRSLKKNHFGLQAQPFPLAALPEAVRLNPQRYSHLLDEDFLSSSECKS